MKTRNDNWKFFSSSKPFTFPILAVTGCLIGCLNGCTGENANTKLGKQDSIASPAIEDPKSAELKSDAIAETKPLQDDSITSPQSQPSADEPDKVPPTKIITLFDGKSLEGWEASQFGGQGETNVADEKIILEPGFPLTGIHSQRKDLPTANYEILVEARKLDGIDFFCGLTFPVNETHCSFIVGGWAGTVVGLSMIDDKDASENETRKSMKFETGQWYSIRTRVLPDRIQCWIDDKLVVDQDIKDRKISLRNETLLSRPLGICSFETKAEIRKFELHILKEVPPLK